LKCNGLRPAGGKCRAISNLNARADIKIDLRISRNEGCSRKIVASEERDSCQALYRREANGKSADVSKMTLEVVLGSRTVPESQDDCPIVVGPAHESDVDADSESVAFHQSDPGLRIREHC
jgi:hypothetical protein